MVSYPLFHRIMGDNCPNPSGNFPRERVLAHESRMKPSQTDRTFYEFFAGGGMARAGLGEGWTCLFANDFDRKKGDTYRMNWGGGELRTLDVSQLKASDLPGEADLAWASFPCQDLSLAGGGAGLKGERSGTFWPFWKLMKALVAEGRAPRMIVLENVCGTLTSHEGKDFAAICNAVHLAGYHFGALVVDAAMFVPQSRPRLFIVCAKADIAIPGGIVADEPSQIWHGRIIEPNKKLSPHVQDGWVWWNPVVPPRRTLTFADLVEENPSGVDSYSQEQVQQLILRMSPLNRAKLEKAKRLKRRVVGGLYRRTRIDDDGSKVQRSEIRFDGLSGCLRTPAGGSSRQTILIVNGESVEARLISTRETARLMGLPDSYMLPDNYNEAYHLTGDGVVVPVVRHLSKHIFEPILSDADTRRTVAA